MKKEKNFLLITSTSQQFSVFKLSNYVLFVILIIDFQERVWQKEASVNTLIWREFLVAWNVK